MLVFFDLETSGLDSKTHEIIQFAAIAVDDEDDWKELDSIELKFVFDEDKASKDALIANHYDPNVWGKEALSHQYGFKRIVEFLRKYSTVVQISPRTNRAYKVAQLAGHNVASFDMQFLIEGFQRANMFLNARFLTLDTLQLALWASRKWKRQPKNFKLEGLAEFLEIEVDGDLHDALTDVRVNIPVARAILERRIPDAKT